MKKKGIELMNQSWGFSETCRGYIKIRLYTLIYSLYAAELDELLPSNLQLA